MVHAGEPKVFSSVLNGLIAMSKSKLMKIEYKPPSRGMYLAMHREPQACKVSEMVTTAGMAGVTGA